MKKKPKASAARTLDLESKAKSLLGWELFFKRCAVGYAKRRAILERARARRSEARR